jgi:hypothetical protein
LSFPARALASRLAELKAGEKFFVTFL